MPITCTVKTICIKKTEDLDDVEVISEVLVIDNMLDGMRGEWPLVLSIDVGFPGTLVIVLIGGQVLQFDITVLIQGSTWFTLE